MAYPESIDKFTEKLNKLDNNTYVIEEVVTLTNGVYEGELEHDNVSLPSINVYTGSKLTGTKVDNVIVSTPSLTPWKRTIKIFSDISPVYISYQTQGDTVEAEDINRVQDSIVNTQIALNAEKDRAIDREDTIEDNLNSEISRAKQAENTLTNNLNAEINRAKGAENVLTNNLNSEVNRATQSENNLNTALTGEINRAKNAEQNLTDNLNSEIERATGTDETLTESLSSEINRAKQAENSISNTINTNKPNWDDKYTKNEIDNKISQVITDLDWKEAVSTYADIATTYLNPEDGWTVNVKDTDITYRYNGTGWVAISANSIPLATSSVDGKMSKQDKINLDDTNSKKHTHNNLSILQTITQALMDAWNDAYTHISDVVKHITSTERTLWNTVSNKVNKSGDTITGQIKVRGAAADRPLVIRGISGATSGTDDTPGELYLNYDSDKVVHIGTTINIDPVNKTINAKSDDSGKLNGQDASYYAQKSHNHDDRYYTETESNNKFATKDEISNAGYGDMLKSVYDTNGNGIVDKADDSNTVGGKSVNDFTKRVILTGKLQKNSYRRSVIAPCELTNTNPSLNSYSTGIISFKRGNGITELTSLYVGAEKLYNSSTMHYFGLGLGRSPDLIRPCTFTYNGNVYGGIEFKFSNAESNQVEFNGSSTFNIFGLDYYDTQNNVPLNEEVNNSLNFDTTINKLPNLLYNNDKIALQKDVVPKGCTWNDLKGV